MNKNMTKEEQLKIYAVYLPYGLEFLTRNEGSEAWELIGLKKDERFPEKPTLLGKHETYKNIINIWSPTAKPVLYPLDYLTKEQLIKAGFEDHIDWLTNEREGWIKKYGLKNYLDQTPYGHIQYLISEHFNIFSLPEGEYINKATLKNGSK